MEAERWQKIRALFDAAVELAPAKRRRFIEKACGADDRLRREVEKLLDSFENARESFMEQPAAREIASFIIEPEGKLQSGESLGHYEIIRQIGAGGMGEVYLARDQKLDRQVAVKVLNEKFSRDESNLKRFVQEARAASSLNHPNILVVHEIGAESNANYIVSEFVEGKTLRDNPREASRQLPEILDIAIQISNALLAAHAANIIHRDIKPENVMVRPDGYVKVLDFGLAKLVATKDKTLFGFENETVHQSQTAKGLILGTISYMSPEQARGERVDERTDIFSLGVVIYEMIAGRTPFAGDSSSETFANLINREPQPLTRCCSAASVPDELQRIVAKMLSKNKDERYQTMKDLLADLKSLREKFAFDERSEKSQLPDAKNETKQFQTTTGEANIQTTATDSGFVQQINLPKPFAAFASLILLATIGFGYWFFVNRSETAKPIESIAVLPFVNESGNSDVEYLSDGMTESLINSLSQIPKLNVRARSSVFRYKGKDDEIQKIGKQLKVEAILNGRVVQRGDELTLYLSLEDVNTGNQIWGEQYNKKPINLIALQTEIVRDVSNKLRAKLSGADEQRVAKQYTANPKAYQLYLQGRHHWNKRTGQDLQKAIEYFEQAIALDPNYALAYTGLADAYALLSNYSGPPPHVTVPKARAAALTALSLDDQLAEAHAALGLILTEHDYDFVGAEAQYRRAIELNPNYAPARQFYGELLSHLGRPEEAFAEMRRALEIDPLSLVVNRTYAGILYQARRYDDALAQLQKTLELDANFASAHATLSVVYNLKGEYAAGNEAYAKFQELAGLPERAALVRESFARGGRERVLQILTQEPQPVYLSSYIAATFYAELGEKDRAFAKLNESYEKREYQMVLLKGDPRLDPLRDDPRFQDLMQRVGFEQ